MCLGICIEVNNCHLSYFLSSDNVCPTNQHTLRLFLHRLTRVMPFFISQGIICIPKVLDRTRRDTPLVIVLHLLQVTGWDYIISSVNQEKL